MSVRPDEYSAWEASENIRRASAAYAGGTWPVIFVTPDGKEFYLYSVTASKENQKLTAKLEPFKKKE